ncbi:MAG: hypothetical protein WEF50_15970 [Myxococcota bacterium]
MLVVWDWIASLDRGESPIDHYEELVDEFGPLFAALEGATPETIERRLLVLIQAIRREEV